ncbi:probable 2' cyclic ADP-D-ribose synthase BdTIR [Corylus avellana]|uniref:probable 2' cyclic ADP-D-ribose synthase BdTIR n=1 Tax=Corylus avellana TaxID=13451 RepID=UPI00286ABD93|nr:probable 2' cyclic ADP-D-ribose synthase BdTIR [Corylus avellana]
MACKEVWDGHSCHPSHPHNQIRSISRPCDVFINHRGIDTKRTISGLLYYHLSMLRLKPFLDSENMKPGEKLYDKIDTGIRNCKLGIAVFSPRYCQSYFCLHELALLMESKKRVIPIFCDVKPSQLQVHDDGTRKASELQQYSRALEEAKYTVGLTFDTSSGNWSEFLVSASDAVIENLLEIDGERLRK